MIQSTFSIKDFENLSGVKAHTIRIWEKRYTLFTPKRTATNIRYYDLEDLKLVLSVAFLIRNGYKISKIAKLTTTEINNIIEEIQHTENKCLILERYLDELKIMLFSFDEKKFDDIHEKASKEMSFERIFLDLYIPFFRIVGNLWLAKTVSIAHEHFLDNLIHRKLVTAIETIRVTPTQIPTKNNTLFILFLPDNELHDSGILLLQCLLKEKGKKVLFLGRSMPTPELIHCFSMPYEKYIFVSYFSVKPANENLMDFFTEFQKEIQDKQQNTTLDNCKLYIVAPKKHEHIPVEKLPKNQFIFSDISSCMLELETH